jgi:hypothetical protein
MGTGKSIDSSAAFLFEVPGPNSSLVVQELQIGGTRPDRSGMKTGAATFVSIDTNCQKLL